MTTTLFTQPLYTPFAFQALFDGSTYSVTIPWSLYGQRYYLMVNALDGTLIVNTPLVGSPDGYDINLINGYFTTSTLVWRLSTNSFEVLP